MKISITTSASGGHLLCTVQNEKGNKILSLTDTGSDSHDLSPGKYIFQWKVIGSAGASYSIKATVEPETADFTPLTWEHTYDQPKEDFGGFNFKV